MPRDLPPDPWELDLEATLETSGRDRIEDVLIVGLLGPITLAIGGLIASPVAGWAFRLFTWAAGL